MKILICPDSFKGTLSSTTVATTIRDGLQSVLCDATFDLAPIADGGEGSLIAIETTAGGSRKSLIVENAIGREMDTCYLQVGRIAYVELAMSSGLPLLRAEERSPLHTSTFGTGQTIREALETDATECVICVGGSATNDAGAGMAAALGIQFINEQGSSFVPTGGTLVNIRKIIMPKKKLWHGKRLTILCDVNNPFTGPTGAVATFAPQKGATEKDMVLLEKGMLHFAQLVERQFKIDLRDMAGAGAAGGVAGGMYALTEAKLVPGLSFIAEQIGLKKRIAHADCIITGEGKLDQQTMQGKVIHGIVQFAQQSNVPVIAICGAITLTPDQIQHSGLLAAFSIHRGVRTMKEISSTSAGDLRYTTNQIARVLKFRLGDA